MSFIIDGFDDINKWSEINVGSGTLANRRSTSFQAVCSASLDIAGLVTALPQDLSESAIAVVAERNTAQTVLQIRGMFDPANPMPDGVGYYYALIRDLEYGILVYNGYGFSYSGTDPIDPSQPAEMRIVFSGGNIIFYYNGQAIYTESSRIGSSSLYVYLMACATHFITILGTSTFQSLSYVTPTHLLSVDSTPTGIGFNVIKGGISMSFVTPWSGQLEEGTYEVAMPSNVIINGDTWNFKAQVDPITKEPISTNPITTVNLMADTTLDYAYELLVFTAIQIHAFYEGAEVNAKGLIVEMATEFMTPATIQVPAGAYTVRLTYLSQTQISSVQVAEGQTIRIDGQFLGPTPIPPVAIVALALAIPAGYILWKIVTK